MSKQSISRQDEKEKVIVDYDDTPILADLEVDALLEEFYEHHTKEQEALAESKKWKAKKDIVGSSIQAAIEVVAADSVTMLSGSKQWKATIVKFEPGTQTDEDKLRGNLMKIGKLDAVTVAKIFAASQVPAAARKPYVRVTVNAVHDECIHREGDRGKKAKA